MPRADVRPAGGGLIRALVLSVAAAAVPVAGTFLFPEELKDYEALTWLLLLVPAFLWAYERGWRGVATALAAGMATLSTTYVLAELAGRQVPDLLLAVVVIYVFTSVGIGLFGDRVSRSGFDDAARRLSLHDALTGLPNRRHAEVHAALQFAAAERGQPLAVVMFDLDEFAAYNERNGEGSGDGVLRSFAAMVRQQTRRMDLAARYGPEEFLSILSGCTEEGALVFASRLQEQLRSTESVVALPTISAGIACYRPDMGSPEELLQAAEQALLLAKRDGRDRIRVHGRGRSERREDAAAASPAGAGARVADSTGVAASLVAQGGPVGRGRTAFLLAGDPGTRQQLGDFLRAEAFAVTEGLSLPDTTIPLVQEFDLLLMDVGGDSARTSELIREIRRRSPATRIVGIPLREAGLLREEALAVRVDGLFVGVQPPERLRQQLAELLDERDALRDARVRQQVLADELRALDRQSRMALAASEARYRQVVQSVQEVVFSTDVEGRWTSLNPAWTAITGFSADESLARPLFSFVHPDDEPGLRARFLEALDQRLPSFRHEGRWRTRGSGHRWLELRLQLDIAPGGGVTGTAGVLADVTERRRAQDALHLSEEYYRSLIEHSGDMVAVLNADGTFRYASPAVERVFGYRPAELTGADPMKLVHDDDQEHTRAGLAIVLDSPGTTRTAELRIRRRSGEWRNVELTCRNELLTPGVDGIVINARDVTERHNAEARLRESEQLLLQAQKMDAIGRLAGGVAHDFNNLLTTIQGHIDLLITDLGEGSPLRGDLTEVREAAERATSLTRQLLAFSRRQVLQPRVLELNLIVRDMEKMLRRVIGQGITLSTQLPDDAGRVRADPAQLEQVLLNLVVNARDAMTRGGNVAIATTRRELTEAEAAEAGLPPGDYVLLQVRDSGEGMTPQVAAQAFDPFFTTKGPGGGTGLGLSTVYGIVKQSGGHVWLRTEPGGGTEVSVALPAVAEDVAGAEAGSAPAATAPSMARGDRETILLVEDEKAVRELTERILTRYGYEVLAAANGREALELLDAHCDSIDMLLTDVVMPEVGGPEVAAAVRQRLPKLPVLFMSGYNEEAVLQDGILAAGTSFLEKPFTPALLLQRLQWTLRQQVAAGSD